MTTEAIEKELCILEACKIDFIDSRNRALHRLRELLKEDKPEGVSQRVAELIQKVQSFQQDLVLITHQQNILKEQLADPAIDNSILKSVEELTTAAIAGRKKMMISLVEDMIETPALIPATLSNLTGHNELLMWGENNESMYRRLQEAPIA